MWPSPDGLKARIQTLELENLTLRHQLAVLQRTAKRSKTTRWDRAFWIGLSRVWSGWREACLLVKPATVVGWHRSGFRLFWRIKSRRRSGRPHLEPTLRRLVIQMAWENPLWGAPRIHGELLKLGLKISERSVARWMPQRQPDPRRAQNWKAFLENHRDLISAMDFLVVPTWNFRLLYVLMILDHGRRMIRHVSVTAHPTAEWVRQQLRDAFPFDDLPTYLLFDRDAIFGAARAFVQALGITPKQIGFQSPWQNGHCERAIGTLRRDLLDHVVVRDEAHLTRLLKEYTRYYHEDRTHLGLNKDSPLRRPSEMKPNESAGIVTLLRCGGLHHRYRWTDAA
ncbi:transposase [Geothrix limicola]|uniref:Transposase n=2 Tax=Geothrix limicola TaxID=2927978 RepID=A0ABQ5QKD2_9BACT|nr:transposase [Geothrix limicola]